jgi:carboxypeptidase PM20D1
VLLVAALAAVVIGRTLMVPVYEAPTASAPASKFDGEKIAVRLAEAVKFRTVSWQPGAPEGDVAASRAAFVAFRDWITATYPLFSQAATREIVGDYTLLFTWPGSDTSLKPILLMSHMDVVPIAPGSEGNWKHPPFEGVIADGYVWGRGTMDNKHGIVGMLEAAEALIANGFRPKRTILFSFGHDEEVGGPEGNAKVAALLAARKAQLEFVVDEGGAITRGVVPGVEVPVAIVGVAEKGSVTLEVIGKADGGHSSLPPPVGETAIGRVARAIGRIGDAPFESRVDGIARDAMTELMPAMPFAQRMAIANLWLFEPLVVRSVNESATGGANIHTTIAPTVISGGNKDNVMPPDAKVTVNFRIHPRDTIRGVIDHVTKAVGDEKVEISAKPGAREPSPTSDVSGPRYALVKRTLETLMPGVIVVPNLLSGGTDARYFQPMTNNVFRMIPGVLTADDLRGFHGTNERMPIASMGLIADFYATLITTADEPAAVAR